MPLFKFSNGKNCINPPTTLPLYSRKEKLRHPIFFDSWKPFLKYIQSVQEATTNSCKKLWSSLDDLIKEFEMHLMPPINEATPTTVRIVEVEEHMGIIKVNIGNLTQVKKEFLEEHMLKPVMLISMTQHFVKHTAHEFNQEVSTKVCDGELVMEKM
jgi:hypothetical protein